jgi:hypothetical protein
MISAIGAPGASNPGLVSSDALSSDALSTQSPATGTPSLQEPDVLSLAQAQLPSASDGFYQRTSLTVRAHSHVRETDDGRLRVTSHTKLRFRYDFEAADGTTIRVRLKANLHYAQVTNGESEFQSVRLRAKAAVSVIQQDVSSELAPLLETPELSAEAKESISLAIGLFQEVSNTATSLFLEGDPLDGDGLITGLVDAFNGLSESISTMLGLPAPDDPNAVPSGEAAEVLEQAAADPEKAPEIEPAEAPAAETAEAPVAELDEAPAAESEEAPAEAEPFEAPVVEPDALEAAATPEVDPEPAPEEPAQAVVASVEPESGPVESTPDALASVSEEGVVAEAAEQEPVGDAEKVRPASNEPSRRVRSAMLKLRFRVIQSLRSLTRVFDSESTSVRTSRSVFSASARLAARYEFGELASHGDGIDTQA